MAQTILYLDGKEYRLRADALERAERIAHRLHASVADMRALTCDLESGGYLVLSAAAIARAHFVIRD